MRKILVALTLATVLLLSSISAAFAADRMQDDSICFANWHGVMFQNVVRGHVYFQILGDDGTRSVKEWHYFKHETTTGFYPTKAEGWVTGETIAGVAGIARHADPNFAEVLQVNAGCTHDG